MELKIDKGQAIREVEGAVEGPYGEIPAADVEIEEVLSREPFEAAGDSALARLVEEVHGRRHGRAPQTVGVPFWTDAALLHAAGADTVLYGPRGAGAQPTSSGWTSSR